MLEAVVSTENVVVEEGQEKEVEVQVKPVVEKKLSLEEPVKTGFKSSITWVLKKDKKSSKSGLTFASKDGIVALRAVEGRAAAKTNLCIGLQVLKVDGTVVTTASEAVKAFASAPAGIVKIVTNGSHHTAKKMTNQDKAGIAIQPYHSNKNLIEIYKVNPDGMFPDLKGGHLLWSINGKRIVSVQQGIKLLSTKKVLMLVVVDPADLGGIKASDIKEPLLKQPMSSSQLAKEPTVKITPAKEEPSMEPNPAEEQPQSEVIWT